MAKTLRLGLASPVALQGWSRGIWVADSGTRSVTCFNASDGNSLTKLELPEPPTGLAAANGFLAAALRSGLIIAFSDSGRELWRHAAGSGEMQLKGSGDFVWAGDKDGAALVLFDRSGPSGRMSAEGWSSFAPSGDSMFWVSKDGVLVGSGNSGSDKRTAPVAEKTATGSMVACANALWISSSKSLLLVNPMSLAVQTSLDAPEGPVPHLICSDGKIAGGSKGVFVLNPMADARVHSLPIQAKSQLSGIAATDSILWALESSEPVVHIADLI